MPLNFVRIAMYRSIGYKIGHQCQIGFGTIIVLDRMECDNFTYIGRNNVIIGRFDLSIGENTYIGNGNMLSGAKILRSDVEPLQFDRATFEVESHCHIADRCIFNVLGNISIDTGTTIQDGVTVYATRGQDADKRSVYIGKNCHIGSFSAFLSGASIANDTTVTSNSIVQSRYSRSGTISGNNGKMIEY